jgi:hypothetical protein
MRVFSVGLLKFAIFAGVVSLVGQWAFVRYYDSRWEYRATERVQMMLDRMQPGGDRQAAACLWSRGSLAIPDGDVFKTVDAMDEWARGGGFETVSAYEILGTRLERQPQPGEEAIVLVDVRINGKPHCLRVIQGVALGRVS